MSLPAPDRTAECQVGGGVYLPRWLPPAQPGPPRGAVGKTAGSPQHWQPHRTSKASPPGRLETINPDEALMDLYTIFTDSLEMPLYCHDFIIDACSQNTSIFLVLVYIQYN